MKKNLYSKWTAAISFLSAVMILSARADVGVQFGAPTSPSQPGFFLLSNSGGGVAPITGTFTGVDASVCPTGSLMVTVAGGTTAAGSPTLASIIRDRGGPANSGSFTNGPLYESFVGYRLTTGTYFWTNISGLAPNATYYVTLYSYDNSFSGNVTHTDFSTGAAAESRTITYTSNYNFAEDPAGYSHFSATLPVTANVNGTVIIQSTGSNNGNPIPILNGFKISPLSSQGSNYLHVFLIGGQSNADGRADPTGLPANLQAPQADVAYYYSTDVGLTTLRPRATQFGPEVTFGRAMADFYSPVGERVAILKYAVGGTNLFSQWKAGGDATTTNDGPDYVSFQNTIRAGLSALQEANPNATLVIEGMIWVQGESDIDNNQTAAYGANLTQFINDVRLTFQPGMPFVFSRISANQTIYSLPTDSGYAAYQTLRTQQQSVANTVAGAYMVDTDGVSFTVMSGNLHFNTGGQQALGNTLASSMMMAVPSPTVKVQNLRSFPANGQVSLAWDSLTGTTSYNIKRSLSYDGPYAIIANQTGTSGFVDKNVSTNTVYYYAISALTGTGETQNSAPLGVVPTFLPAPMQDADIGGVDLMGSAYSTADGTYTVIGSGSDISGTADSCNFAYATLTGDGTITAMVSSQEASGSSPKAGVMMRASLDADAVNVSMLVNPTGYTYEARKTTGTTTAGGGFTTSGNRWVRIVRAGNVFTGYTSPDGVTWSQTGNPQNLVMPDPIYVGLTVSSKDNSVTNASVFSNVTFPFAQTTPLLHTNVGTAALAGGAYVTPVGSYEVIGSGQTIFGTTDSFHFAYTSLTGSGTLTARVASLQATGTNSTAGVMMRASLDADAVNVATLICPTGYTYQARKTTGGTTAGGAITTSGNQWVRIVRAGTVFTGYTSPDGLTWSQVGNPQNLTMPDPIYIGFVVCPHDNTVTNATTFDNVSLP